MLEFYPIVFTNTNLMFFRDTAGEMIWHLISYLVFYKNCLIDNIKET